MARAVREILVMRHTSPLSQRSFLSLFLSIPCAFGCTGESSHASPAGTIGPDASIETASDAAADPLDGGPFTHRDASVVPIGSDAGTLLKDAGTTGNPDAGAPSSDSGVASSDAGASDGWVLTWSDEFDGPDGSAPDPTKWVYDLGGGGWGNNELEYYTNDLANAQVVAGNLVITATTAGASSLSCWNGPCQYTSARINTSGKFSQQYGHFESRIKIPEGSGVWPAFWLLGDNISTVSWPDCGEIDIMENIGGTPNEVYGTTHGPGPASYVGPGLSKGYTNPAATPFGDDFHIYSVDWSAASVAFSVDGTLYWTVTPAQLPSGATWVWDQPFFIILNFAVGGNWPGDPDGGTWPREMLVDYVRVYQPAP